MPNLVLLGKAHFFVLGTKDQVDDVMSDVESGWSNINIDYDEDGVCNTIEFRLSEKISGRFDFIRISDSEIEVTIDGVLKTSARSSAIAALVDGAKPWVIESISGGMRSILAKPAPDTSLLQLARKIPK